MKTKVLYLTVAFAVVLGMSSCKLDYFPSDELNGNALLTMDGGADCMIDGCYAMLKEQYEYVEYASGNCYERHYLQMAEFPGDNICLSGRTSDPLYQATTYTMTDHLKNIELFWWVSYKVIFSANTIIEGFKEGESAEYDQILGEAYFLRALMHFNAVNLCAKPYVLGRDNIGVPLRTSTNTEETTRASVGEVYDQVAADLQKAAELMTKPRHPGNGGYATRATALGLLSRVYLYMEENQKVLDVIAEMGDPVANLDSDLPNYFAKGLSSKETLFAIAHSSLENWGKSSISSMFNGYDDGWGEVYPSDPLLNLYERYPDDKRMEFIKPQFAAATNDVVYFAIPTTDGTFRSNLVVPVETSGSDKFCTVEGKKYAIQEETINGEYKQYFVNYGGEKCAARIVKAMMQRNTYPMYYITKFSYQDGITHLMSPVLLRWGEVLLNRAEAYAKLNKDAEALADVNAIRQRAGIPAEGMFAAGKMHGYTNVLDVVLDERRMELAWEGHRVFDVYRNKRNMDRRFAGVQAWEVIDYNDNRIQYPIPYGEYSVSHIPQNPGY